MESWAALAGQHWAEAALVHCRTLASFPSVGRRRPKTALIPTVSGGLAVWSARELQATRLCVAPSDWACCSASVPVCARRRRPRSLLERTGEGWRALRGCGPRWWLFGSTRSTRSTTPRGHRQRGCRADGQTDGIRHRLDLDPRFSSSMIGRRARRWRQGCMHATRSNPSRAVHSACQRPLDLPPSSAPVQCVYPVIEPAAHRGKHFIHRPSLPPSLTLTDGRGVRNACFFSARRDDVWKRPSRHAAYILPRQPPGATSCASVHISRTRRARRRVPATLHCVSDYRHAELVVPYLRIPRGTPPSPRW